MGSAERKAREKEELRQLILQGARKLFVEKGIAHTTIRNIADAIDYSIGTVYVYFKDKNAILHTLHTQGFILLREYFQRMGHIEDPMDRLKMMGRLYIRFAMENPDMYDLMFNLEAPMEYLEERHSEEWNEGRTTFEVLRQTVAHCQAKGHFQGSGVEPLSFMIWGMVHGMCSLEIRQRTKGICLEEPDKILDKSYDTFVRMLERF